MKFLGLNSPEIFLISVIILSILGPKRIEKGWLSFQRLLKFLLSKEESKAEEPEVIEVKEEAIESKTEEPEVIKTNVEAIEADLNEEKSKAKIIKKEKVKKNK